MEVAQRWYIVHAYSNFEHKVKASLEERIKLMGLEDKFGEILVPTEEVVEMRDGTKRRSERKFFPGYVLVQMEMNDDTWHLVKDAPKVMGFIGGTSDRPAPITQREADAILIEEMKAADLYYKVWQSFAVFLPVQSVGVMGDERTYDYVIALRIVESIDAMTADWADLPHEVLGRISSRIINEVPGVNRVVYDISSKPPATIEWE